MLRRVSISESKGLKFLSLYNVSSKSIMIEAVFTEIEMNNELNIKFQNSLFGI